MSLNVDFLNVLCQGKTSCHETLWVFVLSPFLFLQRHSTSETVDLDVVCNLYGVYDRSICIVNCDFQINVYLVPSCDRNR